jgi:hypothetical protein
MPSIRELQPLVTEPREDLSAEYKNWLDLATNGHRATLAKAAIALANHGGGFIVIGFEDTTSGLQSRARPTTISEVAQDAINDAIRRYASPSFHCELHSVTHPTTEVIHPVIVVPGTMTVPIMSKRDFQGVISQNRCYIRKPGPKSEEPQNGEEWRTLLNRCVRAGRDDMLEAIRSIVSGHVDTREVPLDAAEQLRVFCDAGKGRWEELVEILPKDAPERFPQGYYEMGFKLVGTPPASNLADLQDRLKQARRIKLTGWTPFLNLARSEWTPYAHQNFVEAWVGRPVAGRDNNDPSLSDFWRASPDGSLYTIRGYAEDSIANQPAGQLFDINLPVWRIAEGILFARRLAETYQGVDAIVIRCRFTGLCGRRLSSISHRRAVFRDDVSRTDEIVMDANVTPRQIDDNLVEVTHHLLASLYELFNFHRIRVELVREELNRLTNGEF